MPKTERNPITISKMTKPHKNIELNKTEKLSNAS